MLTGLQLIDIVRVYRRVVHLRFNFCFLQRSIACVFLHLTPFLFPPVPGDAQRRTTK